MSKIHHNRKNTRRTDHPIKHFYTSATPIRQGT